MQVEYIHVHEHWEAYIDGKFFCSADTLAEIMKEVEG